MSLDRQFDPVTLDYVDGDNGGFAEVDVIENQLIFSVFIELESWEGDSAIGAALARFGRETDTQQNLQDLGDTLAKSLLWLVENGSLESAEVAVQSYDGGIVAFEVDAHKPGDPDPLKLPKFLVPVGAQGAT